MFVTINFSLQFGKAKNKKQKLSKMSRLLVTHKVYLLNPMSTPFLFLLLLLLLPSPDFSAAVFNPADNYLITCGATSPTTFNGRLFLPDSSPNRTSFSLSPVASTSVMQSTGASSTASSDVYKTARIFPNPATYTFPALTPTHSHLLRLHFAPFRNLSAAVFSVSAAGVNLLSGFSTNATVVKEFFLPNTSLTHLDLTFSPSSPSPFAFATAIELFSTPPELITDNLMPVGPSTPPSLLGHVLETAYRVNVGGEAIDPDVDTLWRRWEPDSSYLYAKSAAAAVSTTAPINYQPGGPTREVAPDAVYRTAQQMNVSNTTLNNNFNITWMFPVSSGSSYLIRLHFCDIVSTSTEPRQLVFNVFLDDYAAYEGMDISRLAVAPQLATPYYADFLVVAGGGRGGQIRVSVGPNSEQRNGRVNAILNGLEMMKMGRVMDRPGKKKGIVGVVAGSVAGGVALICLVMAALCMFCAKKKLRTVAVKVKRKEKSSSDWSPMPAYGGGSSHSGTAAAGASPGPNLNFDLRIPVSDILLATNNFDEKWVIGHGGFGKVYRGELKDGTKVAVKRSDLQSRQGVNEFLTEITVLSKIRHRHLVSLIGYCDEQGEMILVYEFMHNGSLKNHLYGTHHPPLPWKKRLEACIGAARGLHYLHTGSAQGIIHRDVKSANILLDETYLAKVADFGLSRSVPDQEQSHVSTNVKGSFGYLDPEYFRRRHLTEKSDVYSFGVVLFEVLCGRPALDEALERGHMNLAEWAMGWQLKGKLGDIVDVTLAGDIEPNSLRTFGETAAKCVAEYGADRPAMGDVLWNLEYALQLHVTAVRREAHEDSSAGAAAAMPKVGRAPSGKNLFGEGEGVAGDGDVESRTVFSLLMSSAGR